MTIIPMKSKFLLLTLLAAAGLIAADAPADAPAGTPPPAAGEPKGKDKGEKSEKGGDKAEGQKGGMPDVPGVSPEDMKKLQEARKAAMETPEVKAAKQALDDAKKKVKDAPAEEKKAAMDEAGKAGKAYYEAVTAAIIKADPSLADTAKKVDDFMKNRNKKPKGGKKPEGDAPAAPAAAPATAPAAETK
jgi:hypothetical protein